MLTVLAVNAAAWGQETPAFVMPSETSVCGTQTRIWGSAEYLLWWVKNNNLSSPLQNTTSNPNATDVNGNNVAAGLGRDGTSVLLGNGDIRYGALSGMRLTVGSWLDTEGTFGIEARGFFLGQGRFRATRASGANGSPVIGVPIIDAAGLFGGGENAIVESFPGTFSGSSTVTSRSSLWGAEANAVINLRRNDRFTADLLVGFRYADLSDDINLSSRSSNILSFNNGGGVFFLNNFFDGTVTSSDTFRTRNQFYGGQIGIKTETQFGKAFVDVNGRLALGATHQMLEVHGFSTLETAGAPTAQTAGGTLALASNSGRFTRNEFSVIPEVEIKLGYNLTERIRGFAGYNFMYWSNVARSGEQIDRNIDVRQVPTLPTFDPNFRGTQPAPQFRNSGYWAQGVTFGVEFLF
jgi:hypothetical protein